MPAKRKTKTRAAPKPRARKTFTCSLKPDVIERLKAASAHYGDPMSYILEDLITNELVDRRADIDPSKWSIASGGEK
jgi:hypothetical protein